MPLDVNATAAVCVRCGHTYEKRRGSFSASYSSLYKGIGYLPVCKNCVDKLYSSYLSQCNDQKTAARQVCRKLDIYWNDTLFDNVLKKAAPKSIMTQYIAKTNATTHAGKSYDDTLIAEGTLWSFNSNISNNREEDKKKYDASLDEVPKELIDFWGEGYSPEMYRALDKKFAYLSSRLPGDNNIDIGAEMILKNVCVLDIDISRCAAEGKPTEKQMNMLNTWLSGLNLKPIQKKQDDIDAMLTATPLGVWIDRYEHHKPLPGIDDDLKDVNGLKKYIFTWLGHVCKMLGKKNAYSDLYESEIERLKVELPTYDGDDDAALATVSDHVPGNGDTS